MKRNLNNSKVFTEQELKKFKIELMKSDKMPLASQELKDADMALCKAMQNYLDRYDEYTFNAAFQAGYDMAMKEMQEGRV